jgi:hydroxymethylpyrimidine pyrophosphatase-like HAD family hydrolase
MLPRLIAIDMDGTLLHSDGSISARNRAALRLAEDAGIEVVIATGRRHSYAMRVLRGLDLDPQSALVSSNGTVIRTIGGELLHRTHLSKETALWLCDHVREFRNAMVITFDRLAPNGDDTRGALVCEQIDDLHASIGRWMQSNEPYIQRVDRLEDALLADDPIQMMIAGSVTRMAEAEARLLEHPRITAVGDEDRPGAEITLHRTSYPDRDLSIVDILPAGCSKASALEHLLRLRGLSAADVLAIGDNWNDVPMLRLAGRSALMANAADDLLRMAQASGWEIVPSNDEDGVAVAIEAALAAAMPDATETPAMVVS